MTTYVAFTTTADFNTKSQALTEKLNSGSSEPLNSQASELATTFVDCLLNAMIFNMMDAVTVPPFTEKVMKQVGNLASKTAHGLINKIVGKLNNGELLDLANYIDERKKEFDGITYLTFPLSNLQATSFEECFEKIDAGEGGQVRRQFANCVSNLSDLSLEYYYKTPMTFMKLGMILSKLVDAGYFTIKKAIDAAIPKVFKNLKQEEMEQFATYFKTLLKVDA